MSEAESTKVDLIIGDTSTEIGNDRILFAQDAAWEIALLCKTLRNSIARDDSGASLIVRGISTRIEALSDGIIGAIADDVQTLANLNKVYFREEAEA